jgi:ribosomal protein L11 methyltransferase
VQTSPRKREFYLEAALSVRREIHELVCNYIIENYSSGLVLEDEEDSPEVGIKFYVPESSGEGFKFGLAKYINAIDNLGNFSQNEIRIKKIANIEWERSYRDSIKPIKIDNIIIRPPWVEIKNRAFIEIIIEPKLAFGTGSHETTKLCLREINRRFRPGMAFFDLGCGSGILTILAAKLGAAFAKGVDIDVAAVKNARENLEINKISDRATIEFGSVEKAGDGAKYDFFAANLIKGAIVELYERISALVKPGGIILLSGLLEQDKKAMAELLNRPDISEYEINQDGQWLAYTIIKR